ncbi:MAG TPA: kelch repeat-containing protein [Planctomycetota bacterium]|nr:kelch repeat-containing protein [Planctomycetota bacterium]
MSRIFFPSFIIAAVALAGASPVLAQQVPTGTWAAETGSYFYYGAAVTDGTYIYLFGGYQPSAGNTSGDAYRVTRRYDPVNNTYVTMGDMPTQIYLNSGVYYNLNGASYLYSFGNGYAGTGAIYRMDIAANTWSQVGNLLGSRYGTMAAVLGSKVFVAGGYLNGYSSVCDEFDPSNNTTTARASMPGPSYMGCMTAVPALDKAYVIGGYNNGYINVNYEFTPPSGTTTGGSWTTRAAMVDQNTTAAPRGELPASFSVANRVYVAGGYSNNGATTTLFEYLPSANTWAQRANMTYQRYYAAATALNGKGYVFGGGVNPTTAEEYTPPAFGSPPNLPTAVGQIGATASSSLQAQADSAIPDGWTNNQISFTADVTDPDAGQQVRLRVQVKPQSAAWTQASQVTSLATALGPQGVHTLSYAIPSDNGYDWRWRVEDAFGNGFPAAANTWVEAFGTEAVPNTNSPDFRSDQIAPADPVAISPTNVDIQVPDPVYGAVTLHWVESTDNGPVSGISYELQVARDGGFLDIEAQLFSTAGTSSYPISLTVSRYDKFWRIRARDVGGNFSNWSGQLHFRVTYNDGVDHGGGDSKKSCGFGAAAAAPALAGAMFGLALLLCAGRRFLRKV